MLTFATIIPGTCEPPIHGGSSAGWVTEPGVDQELGLPFGATVNSQLPVIDNSDSPAVRLAKEDGALPELQRPSAGLLAQPVEERIETFALQPLLRFPLPTFFGVAPAITG